MEYQSIFYDTGNGNRLRIIEARASGTNIYEDLDAGGRVICAPEDVDLYPRQLPPRIKFDLASLVAPKQLEIIDRCNSRACFTLPRGD